MSLFLSTFENKVDQKGRVSVPSQFRSIIQEEESNSLVLYESSINKCIEGCCVSRIEELSKKIDDLDPFSNEKDAFLTIILGGSAQLQFDKDGRILLPKNLLDFANRENHHILGAELAEGVLIQDGFSQEFVDKVKLCIINHRASVVNQKFSKEEICVADADAISHLDSVVELICWRAYLGEDISTCNKFVKTKIQKSYAKMSKESQQLMKDKYESIMKVLL